MESKINEDLNYEHIHVSIKIEHSTPSWLKLRNFTEAEKLFNMGFILERIKRLPSLFCVPSMNHWFFNLNFFHWNNYDNAVYLTVIVAWGEDLWKQKDLINISYFCGTYAMNIKDSLGSCGEVSNRTRELQRANVDFLAS